MGVTLGNGKVSTSTKMKKTQKIQKGSRGRKWPLENTIAAIGHRRKYNTHHLLDAFNYPE